MPGDSFHAFVKELLAGVGDITIKRMFGGAGVYADGLMFALLADDMIYLKADEPLRALLKREGSGPFMFTPSKGKRAGEVMEMGYWRLPDAALDDPDVAAVWGRKALAVAKAKAAEKVAKKKPKKRSS